MTPARFWRSNRQGKRAGDPTFRRHSWVPAVWACALAAISSAQSATAEASLGPLWSTRDVVPVLEELQLPTEDQARIIGMLLSDYERQWVAARDQLRDRLVQLAGGGESEQAAARAMQQFRREHRRLEADLDVDVRLLLDSAGQATWEAMRLRQLRLARMPHGVLIGERVDLVDVLAPIVESVATDKILADWAITIDDLLLNRQPFDLEGPSRYRYLVTAGQDEEAMAYLTSWVALREEIRACTVQSVAAITVELTETEAVVFEKAVHDAMWAGLQHGSRLETILIRAASDDTLATNILSTLRSMLADCRRDVAELRALRERIVWNAASPRLLAPIRRRLGLADELGPLQQQLMEIELARRAIEADYMERVAELLGKGERDAYAMGGWPRPHITPLPGLDGSTDTPKPSKADPARFPVIEPGSLGEPIFPDPARGGSADEPPF